MLKDLTPQRSGDIERSGHRIQWEEFGDGEETVLLLPTWPIVHSYFWRHEVPFLAARYRVVVFDGLGNGASDRPTDPALYGDLLFADDAARVLDAKGTPQAAIADVSQGGAWALAMAARHPDRVTAAIFIAASIPLTPPHEERQAAAQQFDQVLPEYVGWSKWNRNHWLGDYPDFLRFFFSKCFTEPGSEAQIEHFFQMGMETTPEVLLATVGTVEQTLGADLARQYAARVRCPGLVVFGTEDAISRFSHGVELARLTGARLKLMDGAGHEPRCRFPATVNDMIAAFLDGLPWR